MSPFRVISASRTGVFGVVALMLVGGVSALLALGARSAARPSDPAGRVAHTAGRPPGHGGTTPAAGGIHKIRHVVVIMQENRSFDTYFGTYPGADGIPMRHGKPTVCSPDPHTGICVRPYRDKHDVNAGGPHELAAELADVDQGRMDGFIRSAEGVIKGCLDTGISICQANAALLSARSTVRELGR